MGEVYAQNMGVNIKRFRVELILLSSVLSACVTAFAGPISFVGIAAPHLIKFAVVAHGEALCAQTDIVHSAPSPLPDLGEAIRQIFTTGP